MNASKIFQSRTRMIDVKNNFRNKYADTSCRACGSEPETQEHVLETCQILHQTSDSKVSKNDIFAEDTNALRETAQKIIKTLDKLANINVQLAHEGSSSPVTRGST